MGDWQPFVVGSPDTVPLPAFADDAPQITPHQVSACRHATCRGCTVRPNQANLRRKVQLTDRPNSPKKMHLQVWTRNAVGVKTLFIDPGCLWEDGYIESFNGKLRDELLDWEIFDTLLEAKVLTRRWRQQFTTVRPHCSLGCRPPAPDARLFTRSSYGRQSTAVDVENMNEETTT